ncbi:PstS family phosphate ABC transporter substrate-binding protein [Phytoactinopolyspora limicola]|uniref:PstS family phosphate ABC transporter substrate-binding protein n=1 Tax=Phytoactinopolyspora limicola TaxID=2715536 RepID=UPI001A9C726B|nr:PstS family phosphate ABC transporter substrate-binding protein [Phytoactinopolyspora limicola]
MKISNARRRLAPLAVAGAAALVLAACGGDDGNSDDANAASDDTANSDNSSDDDDQQDDQDDDTQDSAGDLSGSVVVDGSSTVAPLGEAAAELFMMENPGVRVTVGTSGTGGGFEKFCNGETDISEASRHIKDEESEICQTSGIAYEGLTVANDALTVLVHPDNPVQCLSVEQLNQIWAPDSNLSSWDEIDGIDYDAALDLYGPGTDSGTFDYFTEAINGEGGAQRTDYNNIGEDDNTGIIGVEGSAGGMFYVGFSYYVENQDRVKALEIDGGDGCVAPSLETVQDGSYSPLARGLYIYPSDSALEKPEVLAFVEYFINNADPIAEAAGFIGMTDEQANEARAQVQTLVGG